MDPRWFQMDEEVSRWLQRGSKMATRRLQEAPSWPRDKPKLAQSQSQVSPKSAPSQPNVGPKSTQRRPQVSPKPAPSQAKVGPESTQSRPKVGQKPTPSHPPLWVIVWSKSCTPPRSLSDALDPPPLVIHGGVLIVRCRVSLIAFDKTERRDW